MKRTDLSTAEGQAVFFARVNKSVPGGCWYWLGAFFGGGYGRFKHGGKDYVAHRVSYEIAKGSIPEGLELDHLCRTRACVNPDHLEPVTPRENQRRGETFTRDKSQQTHCIKGHPLSGKNLFVRRNGSRRCQTCERARQKILRATPAYKARHAELERRRRRQEKNA